MKVILFLLLFPLNSFAGNFEEGISIILKHEGRLIEDKDDRGGITNYGISLRYLKGLVATRPDLMSDYDLNKNKIIDGYDIIHIPLKQAINTYKKEFWLKPNIHKIDNQLIANKVFDMAVNIGERKAIQILQETLNKFYGTYHLAIDGKLGNITLSSLNALSDEKSAKFLVKLKLGYLDYYQNISKRHPVFKKFLGGWIKRATE